MRRATENQGNTRPRTECFSSKDKVKDLTNQQRSLPHFASFLQETPMKPSQVPNQLPFPAPRRMLSLESPELCHRDRPGPPWHPPHPQGPLHLSGFVPSSPTSIRSSVNGPHHTEKDRHCPAYHSAQPPGSPSSRVFPVSLTNSSTTANRPHHRPPSNSHPASAQFMKDLSNHSPSSHIKRDKMITLSYSGSKHVTAQRQESNKVQSSDLRAPVPTVQLHRPPMTPSLNIRVAHDVCPQPLPDHRRPGNSLQPQRGHQPSGSPHSSDIISLPIMHSSGAPFQDPHCERLPPSDTLTPEVDSSCSSQKRCREFEHSDRSAKKLCLAGANSGKAQMPKPTVGNSLSTSPASQPPSRHSSALEPPLKTTDSSLSTKAACSQSTWLELSSTTSQSSGTSLSPQPCTNRRPAMGAKQALINSTQSNTVELIELRSPSKVGEALLKKRREENDKTDKSSEFPHRYSAVSPHFQSGSHCSGHTQSSTSASQVKTLSRNRQEESKQSQSSTPKPAPTPRSGSVSCRTVERHKTARLRKSVPVHDDIDQLFTPDPMTYVVSSTQKTGKPRIDGGVIKSPTSDKSSCNTVSTSSTSVTGTSFHKPQAGDTKVSTARQTHIFVPTVILERVKLENFKPLCSKDSELKKSHNNSSDRQLKDESDKSDEKRTAPLTSSVTSCTSEADTAASAQTSASHCSPSPVPERQASEGDPIDVELDLGLSFALDLDLTQSSHSSEGEQLLSFQEIMECVTKPPDTPEKGAFSEPSTPGQQSCPSKLPLPSTTKMGIYKNNLDQMLKEINTNKRAKEIETRLLTACKEDLLRIAEYEEAEENREEGISTEHQEFLQRYSLMSNAIREVPPGEVVFNLQKFGQIFDHNTLQLRQCIVNPHRQAQKTLLWSSPAQLRLHVNIGLFQEAYDCCSPCPTQVTRFLFKMMSVHSERMVSEKILQALCDIACTAACQIVKNGSQQFKVWVPSLADVALVLMNMGVAFVTLFPFEDLQPPFTEGDLLEDIYIKSESPSSNKGQSTFPEHNYNNILRYLSYCMGLCPRAYSDDELLLLLTVFGRLALDTQLVLQSSVELYPLQYKIVNNIRDWSSTLPRICLALTELTDDHHNMCLLVQLLPDNTRGKQLRRHLSLSMISKLLDGSCTYRPTEAEIELCKLRPYLPRMQPSTILRGMVRSSRSQKDKEEDMTTLDQQSYYLCYSLLTLANEASNFQFFPAHQKEQLLVLCSELETHVKCDIRESEKCLYRSKVKDLVARIYTKWQMLLQRTRPLHGKLYDYWQPLPVDALTSSQEEPELENSDDGEEPAMDEDEEEETSGTEDNEVVTITEDEEKEDDTMDDTNKTGEDTESEEMDGNCTTDDTNKEEEARESVHGELNQEMPEMEAQIQTESEETDERIEAVSPTEETENVLDTSETSHSDQEAEDLVS